MNSMVARCWGCAAALSFLCVAANAQATSTPPADCAASGTVINAITKEPVPGAMVTIGSRGTGSATDADGRWSISSIACEVVAPTAKHAGFFDGHYGESATSGYLLPGASEIHLLSGSPATNLKIALAPEGSISGRVQDANGNPVDHADIGVKELAVSGGKRLLVKMPYAQTNGRGEFWLGGLRPGRYVVCANSPNPSYPVGGGSPDIYLEECFPGAGSTMEIRGSEAHVSLTLRTAHALHVRGRITGRGDMQGIHMELARAPGDPLRDRTADGIPDLMPFGHSGVTGPDGSFDISGVPPGAWQLEALAASPQPGGEPLFAEARINVGAVDVEDVHLALAPFGSLSGSVRFESSKPKGETKPANVTVQLAYGVNGSNFTDAEWDNLNFVIRLVAPGEYLLNVSPDAASGYWVKSATLRGRDVLNQTVRVDGAAGPLEIVLSDAVSGVNITTADADGKPANGVIVMQSGPSTIFALAGKGYVEKHGVAPGEYKVWAFDDISTIPWADSEWMTQNAGPGKQVTVKLGETASVTVTRVVAPQE